MRFQESPFPKKEVFLFESEVSDYSQESLVHFSNCSFKDLTVLDNFLMLESSLFRMVNTRSLFQNNTWSNIFVNGWVIYQYGSTLDLSQQTFDNITAMGIMLLDSSVNFIQKSMFQNLTLMETTVQINKTTEMVGPEASLLTVSDSSFTNIMSVSGGAIKALDIVRNGSAPLVYLSCLPFEK